MARYVFRKNQTHLEFHQKVAELDLRYEPFNSKTAQVAESGNTEAHIHHIEVDIHSEAVICQRIQKISEPQCIVFVGEESS